MKSKRKLSKSKSKKKRIAYELRALGWAVEVNAHRLIPKEINFLKQYCLSKGQAMSMITDDLEEVIDGYNKYHTNIWQSGVVPVTDLTTFLLVGPKEKVMSLQEVIKSGSSLFDAGDQLIARADNKTLVYFEESKGTTCVWLLEVEKGKTPKPSDFSFSLGQISVGDETITYFANAFYKGKALERDYDAESLVGKASYYMLI